MLDIRRLREQTDAVRTGLAAKGVDPSVLDKVLALDAARRALLAETETLKGQRNTVSKDIGNLKRKGEDTSKMQASMRELGEHIAALEVDLRSNEDALNGELLSIPNTAHHSTPPGKNATDNVVVREYGRIPSYAFAPKGHVDIAEDLGLVDFARATKLTGAGFALYTGRGARLQRALIQFMLDVHVDHHGYREVWPPAVVSTASMTGTGQLPKMADDMYRVEGDDLYLIPTAEVPVTNIYRDEIIAEPLPLRLTAYTPCFRREAGAAGKDTRGLIRMHQFDKVELVKFVTPETSFDELELLLADAEDILQRLNLPYRVLRLCGGDLSFAAAKCYDIELWAPGQKGWLEVSSCSNFEDFQARRAGIRYRDADGKVKFVHTLNGSGVALARLYVAILENGQQADGSVILPDVIVPYMGGTRHLERQK
ncbi:MAG: serine--tRNA ligase [Verrucomicrobia bacterium]|nr:serine--tRNA ligase [Verrucomicrobiota bacterium]